MDLLKIIEGIDNCNTFKSLNKEEKTVLAAIAEPLIYKKGQIVFSMDQLGERIFYIVYAGHLSLKLKSKRGPNKEFKQGDLFGEISIFTDKYRLGTIECLDDTILLAFDKKKLFNPALLSSQLMLNVSIALTQKIVSYFYADDNLSSKELINQGESERVEFKAGLNQNIGKIVETMIAFMNLSGGTIFIGVEDDGIVTGLDISENEEFPNGQRDLFRRKVFQSAKSKIDKEFVDDLVNIDWDVVEGKVIMRIDCSSSDSPVFYIEKKEGEEEKEHYIVRTLTGNKRLSRTSEIVLHITKKFKI